MNERECSTWNAKTRNDIPIPPQRRSTRTQLFPLEYDAGPTCEREGGEDAIEPQVFFPARPLALTLPSQLPSHLAPPLEGKTDWHCEFQRLRSATRPFKFE